MDTALSYAVMNYSAKTTVGGHPFAIWVPASTDGRELAPLEQFGFVVTAQRRSGPSSQLPSTSSAVAQTSPASPPDSANTGQMPPDTHVSAPTGTVRSVTATA
jgi:hypothetical protein